MFADNGRGQSDVRLMSYIRLPVYPVDVVFAHRRHRPVAVPCGAGISLYKGRNPVGELVANPGWQPGFPTSCQLVRGRLVGCGLKWTGGGHQMKCLKFCAGIDSWNIFYPKMRDCRRELGGGVEPPTPSPPAIPILAVPSTPLRTVGDHAVWSPTWTSLPPRTLLTFTSKLKTYLSSLSFPDVLCLPRDAL